VSRGRGAGQRDVPLRPAAGPVEHGQVRPHLRIVPEAVKRFAENSGGCWAPGILNAVVHPLAFPPRRHQSGFAEVGEVAGDFRLRLLKNLDEVTDTDLAIAHEVEQSETSGVGEGGEQRCKFLTGGF